MPSSSKRLRSRVASVALRTYLKFEWARRSNFVVSGYPKSGTTWVTQLAAQLAGLKYNQGDVRFRLQGAALHTHGTSFEGQTNILYVLRDPRESVCSAARAMTALNRPGVLDDNGQVTDDFVTFAMNTLPGARQSMRDHLQAGIDGGWRFVRFEDLKADPQQSLVELSEHFGWAASHEDIKAAIEAFDFGRQRERNKGNVFFAQSSLASWTGLLGPMALDRLEAEVGKQAMAYGYDLSSRPAPIPEKEL